MKLPILPKITPGIKYPPNQLEDQADVVKKTNPAEYIKEIKKLIVELKEYKQCLEFQGFSVEKLETLDEDKVFARKEVIVG